MKRSVRYCLVIGSFLLFGTLVARQAKSARDQDGQSSKRVDKAFRRGPASFINNIKVFSVPVRDPSPAGVILIAPQDPAGGYIVVIAHGHTSTTYTATVPAPPSN